MTFLGLIGRNIAARRFRSILTAAAVAIGVLSVAISAAELRQWLRLGVGRTRAPARAR
jgi:hypothetical protein